MTPTASGVTRAVTVAFLVLGTGGCGSALPSPAAVSPTPASRLAPPSIEESPNIGDVESFRSVRSYREVPYPTRVRVPSKGIDSSLARVGLARDGTIAAPTAWQQAAWYDRGPRPGQQGPAVIVGHVDSKSGPAVFSRLGELKVGQAVLVDRADGSTARFRVTGRRQFPKNRFPADLVYAPTLQPSLLLITCGGSFDRTTGHYRDNVIVTTVPV